MNFAVLEDDRVKKSEKIDKYLDLVKEQRMLWNTRVMLIPTVVGALGTLPKGLVKELEKFEISERIETIQITESTRILRRVLETCGHSDISERPPANDSVKNTPESFNNNNNDYNNDNNI